MMPDTRIIHKDIKTSVKTDIDPLVEQIVANCTDQTRFLKLGPVPAGCGKIVGTTNNGYSQINAIVNRVA